MFVLLEIIIEIEKKMIDTFGPRSRRFFKILVRTPL